jgi:tetratricopeptide (TPR) repeat protein
MKHFLAFILISFAYSQNCEIKNLYIKLPNKTKNVFEKNLKIAYENFNQNPNSDNLIWIGRRHAYLGNYESAIKYFSQGINAYPLDARFYRHRGHRLITNRCFERAINDLKKAASLSNNKPNEIEPDGLPNALNIPTSTLKGNIYYHLGLAYYFESQLKDAMLAFEKCIELSKNNDSFVAAANWLYIIYYQLNMINKADKLLTKIDNQMNLIENHSYLSILNFYKNSTSQFDIEKKIFKEESLNNITVAFGLGNFYLLKGETEKAYKIYNLITNSNQWSSFAYIGAEVMLKKLSNIN